MKIKICGLSRLEDIQSVNEYQPDYIGFVFAKSRRQVSDESAKELKKHLSKKIHCVGVFVDEDIERIVRLVDEQVIDIVQLHGQEDQDYIMRLRQFVDCPIIKAIKVKDEEDMNISYDDVDYYLLDGISPGSGQTFDWSLIKAMDKPCFVAGGISLDNIDEAIKLNCYGIDVSSGVETNGYKDKRKIRELIRRVRYASR